MAAGMLPGAGGGDEGGSLYRPVSDINVTPFVDVMLVLLIIFMVAAPLMMVGVPVQLPKTSAAKVAPPKTPLVVSIDGEGKVFIEKDGFSDVDLLVRLKDMAKAEPDRVVYVRGDKTITYDRLMQVMGIVSTAGFSKLSMIAETAPGAP